MTSLIPFTTRLGNLESNDRVVDSILDSFFGNAYSPVSTRRSIMTTPRANTVKSEEGYRIEMAAPGFSRDEFELKVDNNLLTISLSSEDTDEYKRSLTSQEYSCSSFSRSWNLPENTNIDSIDARYEAGILSVDIPVSGKENKQVIIDVK